MPPARSGHAAAYDPHRRRMIIYGGVDASNGVLTDTWEFDGASWMHIPTLRSPPNRCGLAYASAWGRTVAFGGSLAGIPTAETWEYDGAQWTRVSPGMLPPARTGHSLGYDVLRGRIVLFGGTANGADLDDTWEYDGQTWAALACLRRPAARAWHSMIYDTKLGNMVAFGGVNRNFGFLGDTALLEPAESASWTRHGIGCGNSFNAPVLDRVSNGVPSIGSAFDTIIQSLPIQGGLMVALVSLEVESSNGIGLPVDLGVLGLPGCDLWVGLRRMEPTLLAFQTASSGYRLMIPNNQELMGLVVGLQIVVLDSADPTGIGALSNGGIMRIY